MSESMIEALNVENKMGKSVASSATLQVSVSFGRFENDSLSWEKWSSFSPNKYLEEVEKCSTPGSVAKKKAYFEAHYKKIAARKAEPLGQEKRTETSPLRPDDPSYEDYGEKTYGIDPKFGVSNSENSPTGVGQDMNVNNAHVDELNEDVAVTTECQSSSVEGDKEEMDGIPDLLETLMENKEKNVKLDALDKSQKVTATKKEKTLVGNKKKLASPLLKSPKISNSRLLKPTPTSSPMSTSQFSTKKANGSSLLKSKNPFYRRKQENSSYIPAYVS
ncbi:hypothetical protein F0562_033694 [Nyssa sinensis]|uniref:TPX2 C-terminal domain-containing protein n=1 Tax=Nyssa sinensis TaxID=561372 RepID=A0A5J5AJ48_9ASTE|nr:hypothetical protein F0562_033694 [Nyssa sinensis]